MASEGNIPITFGVELRIMAHGYLCKCSFCVLDKRAYSKIASIIICAKYVPTRRYS